MKISIITPTLNAASSIRDTLNSVFVQEEVDLEHIIIDGASSDGTQAILAEYERKCSYLKVVSEKDDSLYDAMNKGISMAQGEIIGILNSGDVFSDATILLEVVKVFKEGKNIESVYGDLIYFAPEAPQRVIRFWKSGHYFPKSFYRGWMPPHPTFFVRKSIYEKYGKFNTELKISADYELMLRFLLKYGIPSTYIPKVLVYMPVGGVSNASLANRLRANREDRIAWKINELKPKFYTLIWKPLSKVRQFF